MSFPELIFGNQEAYCSTLIQIDNFFLDHRRQLADVDFRARQIKTAYICLEHFFQEFTGPICSSCMEPCCVNRHGFPDFEDLIVLRAMEIEPPAFNCQCIDTEPCQFLSPAGCILPRIRRSYRCTWYFCDVCMDKFQQLNCIEFIHFRYEMTLLSQRRTELLRLFEEEWMRSCQSGSYG